jgi:3'(2'), 5'-bisphosphate nucleotidase
LPEEPAERYAVSTASHATKLVDEALTAVKIKGLISGTKTVGGAGYKVLCCLEGAAAYVYASGGTKKWDTAATEAVLRAAGFFLQIIQT